MNQTTKKELVVHCRVCGTYIGREKIKARKYMCLPCLNQKRRNEYVKVIERKKRPKAPPKTKEQIQAINRAAYLKKYPNARKNDTFQKPPKEEKVPYVRKPRLKKVKTCSTCKVEKSASEFEGFNRICKDCKEAAKKVQRKPKKQFFQKPAKKQEAPVEVENVKIQHFNNPAKMQTVKINEDRFGRDKNIVRKGWEKTLAQIKKKCLT